MQNGTKAIRFATLIMFAVVFEIVVTISAHLGKAPEIGALQVIVFCLGASLVGRAIAYLTIFEWLRAPFTVVVPHSSGAGEDVHPRSDKGPVIEVIGSWVSCPICAGTWGALGIVLFYSLFPEQGWIMAVVLAAGSVGSFITRSIELIEWTAHCQHETCGRLNQQNKNACK